MAKRSFRFEELSDVSGEWKPDGVPGNHYATVIHQGDKTIVIGSAEGRVTLKSGDTLGYDSGKVRVYPSPESFSDPIRRIMAERRVGQKVLLHSEDPVIWIDQVSYSYPGVSDDSREGDLKPIILGNVNEILLRDETELFERVKGPNGTIPGHRWVMEISGGDAILIRSVVRSLGTTSQRRTRVTRIVIRKHADRAEVLKWLESLL